MHPHHLTYEHSRSSSLSWLATCLNFPLAAASHEPVYEIPWQASEGCPDSDEDQRRIRNVSTEVLVQVRVWRVCRCGLTASLPRRVIPGDCLTIDRQVCGVRTCKEGGWFIRWFAADGRELVWPLVW